MPEATVSDATVQLSYIRAVNEALVAAMAVDDRVIVLGEDVGKPNGPFGATKGLHRRHGDRALDTPISETAMLGAALAAAMRGSRPVVEIMYMDFMLVAMDQLVNQIANTRYVSCGRWQAPLVVRTQGGHSPGSCAQHSQMLETFLAHTPGLRVGLPSTPHDAYSMTRAAIACDDPVVMVESRMLYPTKGDVGLDAPVEPIGGSRRLRDGGDVTLVGWSAMVPELLAAADELAARDVSASVIDLRWLSPLDLDPVVIDVAQTGHVVVAHEAVMTGGFGAEVVSRLVERCWSSLKAPPLRVAALDVPMPAAPALQHVVAPQHALVVERVLGLLA